MTELCLEDLVPRPRSGYRGAPPSVLAAAAERVLLENMLSVGFTAHARLMRNRAAEAAQGWSPAEEGAHRAARALNLLTRSAARLLKAYRDDFKFDVHREFGEADRDLRVDTLAMQALVATDPDGKNAAYRQRADVEAYQEAVESLIFKNRVRTGDYLAATVERLRRYEPEWLTLEQHCAAQEAGEAAEPAPPPEPDAPDPLREAAEAGDAALHEAAKMHWAEITRSRESSITATRVDGDDAFLATTSGGDPATVLTSPSPAPAKRGRGAQPGNRQSLKTGRHTAIARAERADDREMLRDIRAFCTEVDEIAALASKGGGGRAKPQLAHESAPRLADSS